MFTFPFGASFSDRLLARLREEQARGVSLNSLPSMGWLRIYEFDRRHRDVWVVSLIPQAETTAEEVFRFDDVVFYISRGDQQYMRGRAMDFTYQDGVVEDVRRNI